MVSGSQDHSARPVVSPRVRSGCGASRRGKMRPATGLAIESEDLDDADPAVRRRRRCYRPTADQAGRGLRLVHRHVEEVERDVLTNEVVDRSFERAQAIVVGGGDVEIHARRAVVGHLHAGHQRTVELLEDQRIQHVRAGVELAHPAAEVGIDDGLQLARHLARRIEQMPELAGRHFEPGDLRLTASPANDAAVGELATTAGIERRVAEHDLARPRIGHFGLEGQSLRMVVAIEVHCPQVGQSTSSVLAKIEVLRFAQDDRAAAFANCSGVMP